MTYHDGFDRTVSDWLDEQAGHGMPGYLDEVLARTTRTRQRPAWSSLERWLPVQSTLRLVPVPRLAWLLVVLALSVAIGAAVLVAGTQPRLPEPFGLARNGVVVYGASDGDIHAYDVATGTSTAIIAGPTRDETPDFAPNGSMFVFAREAEVIGRWRLMVADADGRNVRPLTGPIDPKWNDWSRDSRRIAVVDTSKGADVLSVYSLDGSAPANLPVGMVVVDRAQWRSPSELVFVGRKGGMHGLYAIATDGTAPRALLPPTTLDTDWMDPVVSPDGSRIAYTKWVEGQTIRVLDIDGGTDVAPVFEGNNDGDGWPTWSPDGTRLVFSRWDGTENHLAVGSVDGGPVVEMGPGFPDGSNGAVGVFSPDGSRVIVRYGFDPEATWLLDPTGGPGERVLTGVDQSATWQRLAR